ncbi:basic amino acid ABC transporter substrate-binding protein [Sutterella sp.]|uniref:basic amino acid ABC transporter substrate-binding protein n=1 Tax=Sutterella sp. TaxID=1981025 RepID=UPI0026DFBAE7|nr:basic amino acid ABC transporter substrate-binding protein [Sutterella sp.]MDO5531798.1 basic amino acid ABC transporter substrate-binding protein [Sutterella sp.]
MKLQTIKRTAAAAAAALLLAGSALADTLTVATSPTFPPFEFVNTQTGAVQGFEVDLIRAVAQKMGRDLKIETIGFDAIIPAVLSGTVDVGASGFSVTPERGKRVLFSTPFYKSGLTIIVAKDNPAKIADFKDLEGKRISVQLGTTSQTFAKKIPGAKVTTFSGANEAVLNMIAGNADAVINDKPVTDYMLTQSKNIAEQTTHLKPIATADLFAMVIGKRNKELKAEIDKALKDLKADGTFNELHKKWFGVDADPELP